MGTSTTTLNYILAGVEYHEGFGTTGSNGHESVARAQAALHDPDAAIEHFVAWNPSDLKTEVKNRVDQVRIALEAALNSQPEPSGNWGPRSVYLKGNTSWVSTVMSGG
jgi:hypothetical protein